MTQLTDRDNDITGEIRPEVVARHIESAESIANSYLATVYKLPLPFAPNALKIHVADIARYYLYDEQPTDIVRERYLMAIEWFKDVAKGVVYLGFEDSTNPGTTPCIVSVQGGPQVFNDNIMNAMDLTNSVPGRQLSCGRNVGWGM